MASTAFCMLESAMFIAVLAATPPHARLPTSSPLRSSCPAFTVQRMLPTTCSERRQQVRERPSITMQLGALGDVEPPLS